MSKTSSFCPGRLRVLLLLGVAACARCDHYGTLGVTRKSTPEEIRKSYRREALRWHPDKHVGQQAQAQAQRRFEEVNEAWSVLSDPAERRRYNQESDWGGASSRSPYGAGVAAATGAAGGPNVLRARLSCTLAQLGGWAPVLVPLPTSGIFIYSTVRLPPGTLPGEPVRLGVLNGIELVATVEQIFPSRFERVGASDLATVLTLRAWHNTLRRAVRVRAVCGRRPVVVRKGETVQPGEVVTLPGYGMPLPGAGGDPCANAALGAPSAAPRVATAATAAQPRPVLTDGAAPPPPGPSARRRTPAPRDPLRRESGRCAAPRTTRALHSLTPRNPSPSRRLRWRCARGDLRVELRVRSAADELARSALALGAGGVGTLLVWGSVRAGLVRPAWKLTRATFRAVRLLSRLLLGAVALIDPYSIL